LFVHGGLVSSDFYTVRYYISRVLEAPADALRSLSPASSLRDWIRDYRAHQHVHKTSAAPMSSLSSDDASFALPLVSVKDRQKAEAIASARFEKGMYWVWLYRDPRGQPHSWERYSVCESGPDAEITIEMSTRFNEDDEFNAHHRMKLSLGEYLASRLYHKDWRFHTFQFYNDGEWCEAPFNDNVQAFEEKFDIFLMDRDIPLPEDRITNAKLQLVEGFGKFLDSHLVQTVRHGYTNTWYAHQSHQHAGLAAFKEFVDDHTDNGNYYTFELLEIGHDSTHKTKRD